MEGLVTVKQAGEGTDRMFKLGFNKWVERYPISQGTNSMSKKVQKYKINAYYMFKNFLVPQIQAF